jgi:6-pyruvoyltetrahydropterin/6-carboxytetrahydropterin synthase
VNITAKKNEQEDYNELINTPHILYVTRKAHFNAAHRLNNPNLSDRENEALFGTCNNLYGHGHNYEIEITLKGPVNEKTGYVFDLKILDELIEKYITSKVDHKHLNYDVDFLKNLNPSAEILAISFWNILNKKIEATAHTRATLYEVKVYESERNFVSYRGHKQV